MWGFPGRCSSLLHHTGPRHWASCWSRAMESLRGGGCVPPGVLSFLAVASPVLLLVALHSTCNIEQQPRCYWPTPGQKQNRAYQLWPGEGNSCSSAFICSSSHLSSNCSTFYAYELNPPPTPTPRCQPLNQGQQEKVAVENMNQPELGAFRSRVGSPQTSSPFVSSHKLPGAGTCPGSTPCLSLVRQKTGSKAPRTLARPPLPTILHCSSWLCFAVVVPPRQNSQSAQDLWQD